MGPFRAVLVSTCAMFVAMAPGPAEGPAVLQRFESRYADARTLQVKFLERYTESGRFVRAEAGTAYFLRPGKMRWDYAAPEQNTFLVDGKYVWFYSPADRTATRMPAKQSEDWRTPIAFLTTHMKLSRLCSRIDLQKGTAPAQAGDVVFRCELRASQENSADGGSSIHSVLFEVSTDGELKRIVVQEEAGMELEFSFENWEWDPPLDKGLFEFVPPRGVAIVNGLLPETPGLRQ
jgi:outer membrane lipoprotein carrier protein